MSTTDDVIYRQISVASYYLRARMAAWAAPEHHVEYESALWQLMAAKHSLQIRQLLGIEP